MENTINLKAAKKSVVKNVKKSVTKNDIFLLKKLLKTKYLEDFTGTPADSLYQAIVGVKFGNGPMLAVVFTFNEGLLTDVVYDSIFSNKGVKKELNDEIYHNDSGVDVEDCVKYLTIDFKKLGKKYGGNPEFVSVDGDDLDIFDWI